MALIRLTPSVRTTCYIVAGPPGSHDRVFCLWVDSYPGNTCNAYIERNPMEAVRLTELAMRAYERAGYTVTVHPAGEVIGFVVNLPPQPIPCSCRHICFKELAAAHPTVALTDPEKVQCLRTERVQ